MDGGRAAELLATSERPLIWAGGGVITSGAMEPLLELATRLQVPAVTTYMGKGTIPETHPLCVGPVGQIGRPETNALVKRADLVLAIGTRFTNLDTAGWTLPARGTRVIHVDIDVEELGRHFEVALGVCSDARVFITALLRRMDGRQHSERAWTQEASAVAVTWRSERGPMSRRPMDAPPGTVHPLQVIAALRRAMDPHDVIDCDSGFNQIWGGQYFETTEAGRSYIGPRGMGVMGYSFPAAIGAKIGDPGRRFVALCGDGGFMMLLHELETSLRMNIPVVVCVMNNRNLEYCTQIQQAFGGVPASTTMMDTDFAAVARAFGCNGIRVTDPALLKPALREALASNRTTVVDVVMPDSVLPDGVSL